MRAGWGTKQTERTYVLETSVLLSDPKAIFRFSGHAIVMPVVIISELEVKHHDPEIGYFARQALRNLNEQRGELHHSNLSVLPSGLQLNLNDSTDLADECAVAVVSSPTKRRLLDPRFHG